MSLQDLSALAGMVSSDRRPPVELWHPAHCGEIDIRIDPQGDWYHEGGLIKRPELVRLFASILRKDGDDYVLVTPAEKMTIQVDDLPFQVILLEREAGVINAVTNVGDTLVLGLEHPVQLSERDGQRLPCVEVRSGLMARFCRNTYYQLVDWAEEWDDGYWVTSGDYSFNLAG
ncbi:MULTISPECIES: DUF1285 domain-containing protein [unclassified Oceanobacter]|uniref:DUF1285 domain-containing protein n=2 Tax=Gammaproteobacteria TaxID=1236 RepID=UPI002732E099|nr:MULTISPECIES: DUF1285 domain-containing protein [unclassified Oceanobacter]MDP2608752.1 DUF1285 domain-containing protein [Oceanobacter sp. 1_MG-2023]MDP2611848.1 DUF1285 domain-containing protein [Oceanobacter sp. 2_MG-2023]